MIIQKLHENWSFRASGNLPSDMPGNVRNRTLPAIVPGCVHTDLLRAELIPDPYWGQNELILTWIGDADWTYQTAFDLASALAQYEHIELVCDGLDTVASIQLNGNVIGHTEDMHLRYVFDVTDSLKNDRNTLSITFASPNRYALDQQARLGALPYTNTSIPYNFIRKMACNFGWDWGPSLITSGIWQPIYLRAWNTARIESVRPLVMEATEAAAHVDVWVELQKDPGASVRLSVTLKSPSGEAIVQTVSAANTLAHIPLDIHNPQLWWPRGYGEQPLYDLAVTVEDSNQQVLDSWVGWIGLRTARLRTEPDAIGLSFVIEVNGQPIFCKGANWIPDDCFLNRIDEARYTKRIQQAIDANMNMLRVWGGGIYEQETFYRLCDEAGMLVWQDVLFACAAYPEEPPFDELVKAEAIYQIKRLSSHPSLVLWNGNNENFAGYHEWGWKQKIGDRTWGAGFYLDVLPRLLAELDPSRSYWPGSPYSGDPEMPPSANDYGNRHVWEVFSGNNYPAYRNSKPRFCSEFGFQAPPTYATIRQSIPADELFAGSPGMAHHQKHPRGDELNQQFLLDFFDEPTRFDEWIYLLQVNQARALTLGVEWYRSLQPVCMGALYWQLNDCWPVTSWAAIDGYGRPKLLWYATRRFFADRLLTFQPQDDGELALFACNDTSDPWIGTAVIKRLSFMGTVLASEQVEFTVPARAGRPICVISPALAQAGNTACELLVGEAAGARTLWFFDVDKRLEYPESSYDSQLVQDGDRRLLTITAHTLMRDISVLVDALDPQATISDAMITLLPGESFTFVIESQRSLTLEQLTTLPVFQCVNRIVRGE